MRKLFLALMLSSALGALAIGGALAWTGTASGNESSTTGAISVALFGVAPTGQQIYPGVSVNVQTGQVQNNTAANPGVPVSASNGTLTNAHSNNGACDAYLQLGGAYSGSVSFSNQNAIAPGGNVGDPWTASFLLNAGAPNDCQNNTFSYDIAINVTT